MKLLHMFGQFCLADQLNHIQRYTIVLDTNHHSIKFLQYSTIVGVLMKIIGYIMLFIVFTGGCSVFQFSRTNYPPEIPNGLLPENELRDVDINSLKISWECSDADNDKLSFSLYLSQDANIDSTDIISESITDKYYILNELEFEKNYYWKIEASDGKLTSESQVMNFQTILFYPDWWEKQDNAEYLYSFGTAVSSSQIASQSIAKENENKKQILLKYADSLMKLYLEEAVVTDPISLKMSDQVVNIVSKIEFPNSFMTRQETRIIDKEKYRSYIRLNISKNEIREVLLKKIISATRLNDELKYSVSFQKLHKEFE